MFERYTRELRKALFAARWTVGAKGASEMEPEHLLAAVLYVAPSCLDPQMTSAVLRQLGYPDVLEQPPTDGSFVPFSERTRSCLADAAARADRLGHRWVRSEHLLATMVAEGNTDAARGLLAAGIEPGALEASALSREPGENESFDARPWVHVVPGQIGTRRYDAV